jgi:hypothetical protein
MDWKIFACPVRNAADLLVQTTGIFPEHFIMNWFVVSHYTST